MEIDSKQATKIVFVEEIMKLMKTYKVSALRLGELELAMSPEYEPTTVSKEDTMSEEDLLFYSNGDHS